MDVFINFVSIIGGNCYPFLFLDCFRSTMPSQNDDIFQNFKYLLFDDEQILQISLFFGNLKDLQILLFNLLEGLELEKPKWNF